MAGLKWGGTPIRLISFYPTGSFNSMRFTFTKTGVDEPLDIFGITFDVVYLE
jgi:hypothetical protein